MKHVSFSVFGLMLLMFGMFAFVPSFVFAQMPAPGTTQTVCYRPINNRTPVTLEVEKSSPEGKCKDGWVAKALPVNAKVACQGFDGGAGQTIYPADNKDKCEAGKTPRTIKAYTPPAGGGTGTGGGGTTTPPTAKPVDFNEPIGTLDNPLGVDNLVDFALRATRILLALIAIAATVVIILSGFRMVIANGNTKTIGDAKTAITYAVIGLIVALMSFSIVAILQNLIQSRL
jgi:hypothetical protein